MSNDASNETENFDKRKKSVHFRSNEQGLFNTSKIALTPSLKKIKPVFIKPEQRSAECVAPPSSITCPNYEGIYFTTSQQNIFKLNYVRYSSASKHCLSPTYPTLHEYNCFFLFRR